MHSSARTAGDQCAAHCSLQHEAAAALPGTSVGMHPSGLSQTCWMWGSGGEAHSLCFHEPSGDAKGCSVERNLKKDHPSRFPGDLTKLHLGERAPGRSVLQSTWITLRKDARMFENRTLQGPGPFSPAPKKRAEQLWISTTDTDDETSFRGLAKLSSLCSFSLLCFSLRKAVSGSPESSGLTLPPPCKVFSPGSHEFYTTPQDWS